MMDFFYWGISIGIVIGLGIAIVLLSIVEKARKG